jgi:predicted nucleic acid-binding protein
LGHVNTLIDTSVLAGIGTDAFGGGLEIDGGWAVSAISVGELHAGVLLAGDDASQVSRLRRLSEVTEAPVLDVDRTVMTCYGELRAATGRLPTNDLWIAATALAHDLTLLTADERQAALPLVRTRLVGAAPRT